MQKRLFVLALGVYRLSTLSKKRDIKAYIMSAADVQREIPSQTQSNPKGATETEKQIE